VRHQVVNGLPLGRIIDEVLRLVDAFNFHEQHGEVCPAGWQQGSKGMVDSPQGVANYLGENADNL
jgi:peroxiredoxin (alkyl hydroperoxide reductase subunit C)